MVGALAFSFSYATKMPTETHQTHGHQCDKMCIVQRDSVSRKKPENNLACMEEKPPSPEINRKFISVFLRGTLSTSK